jgi:4-hydroxy 2-oxovalerate aldolase
LKNNIDIIDVTLRDGGFTCNFDWTNSFSKKYYNILSRIDIVKLVELGYWGQTAKSSGPHYNLNMDRIRQITDSRELKNVSVMIDYHYCNKDLSIYPTDQQKEVSMIRMTARKDMIDDAIEFGLRLRDRTKLDVSFNIFNISNYSRRELESVVEKVSNLNFAFIYMADTHGNVNLNKNMNDYEYLFKKIKQSGKGTGFHLHNHTGRAFSNFLCCKANEYVDYCDTSVMSLGKGAGNLRLEHVIDDKDITDLSKFINEYYDQFFKKCVTPYYLITGRNSITDNYAHEAESKDVDIIKFSDFCKTVSSLDKDNYNKNLLSEFLK